MKLVLTLAAICMMPVFAAAQPLAKPGYFTSIPVSIKNCGAMYTFDTVALEKKKFILLTDFQNLGMININGKELKLQLSNSETIAKNNISTYKGGGYTVILTSSGTQRRGKPDLETGTLQLIKGTQKLTFKIHGLSDCDDSKQEGNG